MLIRIAQCQVFLQSTTSLASALSYRQLFLEGAEKGTKK